MNCMKAVNPAFLIFKRKNIMISEQQMKQGRNNGA